jgi:hypothetical protein
MGSCVAACCRSDHRRQSCRKSGLVRCPARSSSRIGGDRGHRTSRDKVSLDLFWLRDESLEDSATRPDPNVLAQEITDDLRSALGQIEDILGDLDRRATASEKTG